ncbi:NAD-dependent succinate-semialdehyde dehydrogenase [Aerococcaceae bacterium DSM 111022]|nr:NAD-dependent succinate-semialdehyde dehydrogenase [Aerococcaceae bacterium DSM 111022]
MAYKTVNPYTNEVVRTFEDTTDAELEKTLETAHALYKTFRKQDVSKRADMLREIAAKIRENAKELAEMLTVEMGKLIGEAEGEVELTAIIAEYYADNGPKMLEPQEIETGANGIAELHYQSTGVLMMVEPWNFPYYQVIRVFAPNFIVGNPMILKHASNTPGSAELLTDVISSVAPEGSLTNLFLNYDQVEKAIGDPRVQGAALTGSERGGASIGEAAGKNLKQATLELGGMDPFIVLSDANMDIVADAAWRARIYNTGQECTSSKRFIVMEDKYDEFVERLKDNFSKLKPGNPLDPETTLAPMNSKGAKEELQEQVDEAVAAGATVYYGNEKYEDEEGQFFMPTILTDITTDNPVHKTELFGPVAVVYKVSSVQEAIDLANDSQYGLGGSIYTADTERGYEIAKEIETGMMFVNTPRYSLPELPFGGVKRSGFGREMSRTGMMAFINEKLILKADAPDMDNLAGALIASQEI